MPMNMSYCRFENTLAALLECRDALDEDEELSQSEEKAKSRLIRLCAEIAEDFT